MRSAGGGANYLSGFDTADLVVERAGDAITFDDAPGSAVFGADVWREPERAKAALRGVRPDARFEVIPAAGHWVAYEAPQAFEAALRAAMSAAR